MKKHAFEAWLTMVFIIVLDKLKYGELIRDLSIHYTINNNSYLKTLQVAVDVKRKVKFKA